MTRAILAIVAAGVTGSVVIAQAAKLDPLDARIESRRAK